MIWSLIEHALQKIFENSFHSYIEYNKQCDILKFIGSYTAV